MKAGRKTGKGSAKEPMHGLSVRGFISGRERNPVRQLKILLKTFQCAYQRIRYGFCYRDTWSIDGWFPPVMQGMLVWLRDNRHGSPVFPGDGENVQSLSEGGDCEKRWTDILNHMIFLLGEMQEESCSRKNRYEEAYEKAWDEFSDRYGILGEGLRTPEEIEEEKTKPGIRMHTMDEVPEYREISRAHREEALELDRYKKACKDEFFELFSRYFYDLWD